MLDLKEYKKVYREFTKLSDSQAGTEMTVVDRDRMLGLLVDLTYLNTRMAYLLEGLGNTPEPEEKRGVA